MEFIQKIASEVQLKKIIHLHTYEKFKDNSHDEFCT